MFNYEFFLPIIFATLLIILLLSVGYRKIGKSRSTKKRFAVHSIVIFAAVVLNSLIIQVSQKYIDSLSACPSNNPYTTLSVVGAIIGMAAYFYMATYLFSKKMVTSAIIEIVAAIIFVVLSGYLLLGAAWCFKFVW